MRRPIILASCLFAGLFPGLAHAQPASHATQEAPLAKNAEKIKLYCDNPRLAFAVDWPAFENLDYQVLIAGPEGGDPSAPNRAADPSYVAATRAFILTGNQQRSGLPGGPIGGRGGIIVETFERLCRDHAELRGAAAKISKIVLEPINDMKYQSDRDAIAFARKTNDWSGVEKSMYESLRHNDAESRRTYYLRWVLKGSTLTVTFNVMARAGDADDYVKVLMNLFNDTAPANESPPPPRDERPPPPRDERPPPRDERPAETTRPRPPVSADQPGPAPRCPSGDRKCDEIEAEKARKWGPAINCEVGLYAGLANYVAAHDYATGAFVYEESMSAPKQVYRCSSGSGCHSDQGGPGSNGDAWPLIGHCSRQ